MRAWSTRREPGRGPWQRRSGCQAGEVGPQGGIVLCFSHFSSTTSLRIPWVWWQQGWQATPALAVPTEPKLIPIPFLNKHHWRVAQDPDDLPAVAYRGPLTPVKIERLPVTQPAITNLVFRLPLIIGWGD